MDSAKLPHCGVVLFCFIFSNTPAINDSGRKVSLKHFNPVWSSSGSLAWRGPQRVKQIRSHVPVEVSRYYWLTPVKWTGIVVFITSDETSLPHGNSVTEVHFPFQCQNLSWCVFEAHHPSQNKNSEIKNEIVFFLVLKVMVRSAGNQPPLCPCCVERHDYNWVQHCGEHIFVKMLTEKNVDVML